MKKKDNQAKKSETKLVILGKNITSFWGTDRNGKQTALTLSYENCKEQDKELSVMLRLTDEEPYLLDIREAMQTHLGRLWCNATPVLDLTLKPTEERRTNMSQTLGPLYAVSLTEFLRGWSRVGAKVGIYSKGKVVWNEHTPL